MRTEEFWSEPAGGVMLGLHRDVFPDDSSFFEFLRIVSTDQRITYVASPRGVGTTSFALVEIDGQSATFENPGHDFPQRIIYRREDDRLIARIEGETDGGPAAREWVWELVR